MESKDAHPDPQTELEQLRAQVAELISAAQQHAQAESALRESEQLYRRLVETSPDSIVLADVDGRILMVNPQTAVLHRLDESQSLIGKNVLDLVLEEDRPQAAAEVRRIVEVGELRDRQYVLLRSDGSSFFAEITGSLVRDVAGRPKYIIFNGRDVTTRLRAQRELVESQKLESIGRLAGGIAHDFNNLLAVILGNASLQLRNRDLPTKTIECLKDIVEAAERASSLTTQLLAYARGGLRRPVPSDLNKVVQSACEIVRPTLPRQLELKFEPAESLPVVSVDRAQIQQVIINLCMNAIQFSPTPSVVVVRTAGECLDERRARDLELAPGAYATLTVCDQGCGIEPRLLDQIFEPFFSTRPDSRGMGLPASLGIVQNHDGRLVIDSEPGQGTRATVWLPGLSEACDDPARSADMAGVNVPHGCETILVLEPDSAVSHTTEQMLASLGYCVVTHGDADRALAFIRTNCEDIDLILMNVHMSPRAGGAFVDEILRLCAPVPVLLTTGDPQSVEAEVLGRHGAAGFVQKPFSVMSLAQVVRKVLDDPTRPKRPEPDDA